jgi:CotS family spore coat protein
MDSVFSDTVSKVTAHYPFRTKQIHLLSYKGKKAVWSVRTDAGEEIILKKVPFDEKHIRFMAHAIDHLRANGVRTPAVIRTSAGEPFVLEDGANFVAFESVRGDSPEYENRQQLAMMMRGMATFHAASRGIEPPEGWFPSYLLSEWESAFRQRTERLEAWAHERSAANNRNVFDDVFLAHADEFLEQCRAAMETLNRSCFDEWAAETHRVKTLCHQDYAAGNLVIGADGQLYVYDMDSLTVDLPVRDIRKILNKVMKSRTAWDAELALFMLKAYQEVNPLTEAQYEVLLADVQYPHLFYGQASKYYERREAKWTLHKHVSRLKEMIATERSKVAAMREVMSRIGEVIGGGS